MAFALSPKFARKQKKIIDDVISRIFTPAKIEEYWMPKYGVYMDENMFSEHADITLKSITIDHIWPAVVLAIVGSSLAIILFVAEYFQIIIFFKPIIV